MAKFKSRYRGLSFYVDGKLLSFSGGSFSTNDKKVIAVLENLRDVERIDDPKIKESKKEPKAEDKKKDTKKKTSAK